MAQSAHVVNIGSDQCWARRYMYVQNEVPIRPCRLLYQVVAPDNSLLLETDLEGVLGRLELFLRRFSNCEDCIAAQTNTN